MRNKDLIKLLKQDMNEVMPDFDVMLSNINNVKVVRNKVAVPETGSTRIRKKIGTKTNQWDREERAPIRVEKRNKIMGLVSFCLALAMVAVSMFSMGYFADPSIPPIVLASADTYVTVNINPAIDFTVNKNNKITSAIATNASGVVLLAKMTEQLGADSLVGYEINGAIVDTVDMAAQMGYIDVEAEGLTNAMMISVIGKDDNNANEIKSGLAAETKKYFADNGIYAVVITDYDNKDALLEEAKKANPNLDANSSVSDLIANIEKENAGKSVIEAEIEDARRDYENYLNEQYNTNVNCLFNSEISKISDAVKKTEKILAYLEDVLTSLDEDGVISENIGAVGADEFLQALADEYAEKTAKFNVLKAQYESERVRLEATIESNTNNLNEAERNLIDCKNAIGTNNETIENNAKQIQLDKEENINNLILAEKAANDLSVSMELFNNLSYLRDYITNQTKWANYWLETCDNKQNTCDLCIWKTKTVDILIAEGFIYDIINNNDMGSSDSLLIIKNLKAKSLNILAEIKGVTEDKIDIKHVNDIVQQFELFCLTDFNRELYLKGVNFMLNTDNPLSVASYGDITIEAVALNYEQESAKVKELQEKYANLEERIAFLDAEIESLTFNSAELTKLNELLNKNIKIAEQNITEFTVSINTATQDLNILNTDYNKGLVEYKKYLKTVIEDLRIRLAELNIKLNNAKLFKETYKPGDRKDGFNELNDALDALAEKLKADKAANDAEAVAKNVEENIKANADRRYNENVNKYTEHDRKFSEEEYAAWEAEQEKLIAGIDWDSFYKQWLHDNE